MAQYHIHPNKLKSQVLVQILQPIPSFLYSGQANSQSWTTYQVENSWCFLIITGGVEYNMEEASQQVAIARTIAWCSRKQRV